MRYSFLAVIGLTLLFGGHNDLMAEIVYEAEDAISATNNRILSETMSAEWIPASAFTLPAPSTVYNLGWRTATVQGTGGGDDVDFYAFTTGNGSAMFDIDNDPSTFDGLLSLFNSSGQLIAQSDDSAPADSGSAGSIDPFLGTIPLLSAGTYYLAVTTYINHPESIHDSGGTGAAYERPDEYNTGGYVVIDAPVGDTCHNGNSAVGNQAYTLHISLSAVPEPGTLTLLAIGGAIIAAYACRRRKRA